MDCLNHRAKPEILDRGLQLAVTHAEFVRGTIQQCVDLGQIVNSGPFLYAQVGTLVSPACTVTRTRTHARIQTNISTNKPTNKKKRARTRRDTHARAHTPYTRSYVIFTYSFPYLAGGARSAWSLRHLSSIGHCEIGQLLAASLRPIRRQVPEQIQESTAHRRGKMEERVFVCGVECPQ